MSANGRMTRRPARGTIESPRPEGRDPASHIRRTRTNRLRPRGEALPPSRRRRRSASPSSSRSSARPVLRRRARLAHRAREPAARGADRPARDARRARRLRQDDAPRPVGRARRAAVRLALGRRRATTTRSCSSVTWRPRSTGSSRSTRRARRARARRRRRSGRTRRRAWPPRSHSRRPRLRAVLDDADTIRRATPPTSSRRSPSTCRPGSMLVARGPRRRRALPIARLRAGGRLLELGAEELALSRREAAAARPRRRARARRRGVAELASATRGLGRRALPRDAGRSTTAGPRSAPCRSAATTATSPTTSARSTCPRLSAGAAGVPAPHVGARATVGRALRRGPRAGRGRRSSSRRSRARACSSSRSTGTAAGTATTGSSASLLRRELERARAGARPGLHRRAADWFEAHGDAGGALALRRGVRRRRPRGADPHARSGCRPTSAGPGRRRRAWLDRVRRRDALEPTRRSRRSAPGSTPSAAGRRTPSAGSRAPSVAPADGPLPDAGAPRAWIALVRAALCADGARADADADADAALAGLPPDERRGARRRSSLDGRRPCCCGDERAAPTRRSPRPPRRRSAAARPTPTRSPSRALAARGGAGDQRPRSRSRCEARELAASDRGRGATRPARSTCAAAARALLRHGRWDEARARRSRPPTRLAAR